MTATPFAPYEMPELPEPARFATYNGDRANMLGGIYGPNQLGELMVVVDIDHDTETDASRVGFAFATIPLIRAAFLSNGGLEIAPTARRAAGLAIAASIKAAA